MIRYFSRIETINDSSLQVVTFHPLVSNKIFPRPSVSHSVYFYVLTSPLPPPEKRTRKTQSTRHDTVRCKIQPQNRGMKVGRREERVILFLFFFLSFLSLSVQLQHRRTIVGNTCRARSCTLLRACSCVEAPR